MNDLQIVVPMAGQGKRFIDAGYALPKPMLPINGVPMVVRAILDLPVAKRIILLVRSEHIETFGLDKEILRYLPHAIVVPVLRLTEGQACTVGLAAEYLKDSEPVIVAACDNTHIYNKARLHALMNTPEISALIWTYRGEPRVEISPTSHGWVKVDGTRALTVSCKVPISDKPIHDHAVSGFFSFRNASMMIEAIEHQVVTGTRVNNEFYMDTVPNVLIANGKRVEVFEVEKYIGWGTPADYEAFLQQKGMTSP